MLNRAALRGVRARSAMAPAASSLRSRVAVASLAASPSPSSRRWYASATREEELAKAKARDTARAVQNDDVQEGYEGAVNAGTPSSSSSSEAASSTAKQAAASAATSAAQYKAESKAADVKQAAAGVASDVEQTARQGVDAVKDAAGDAADALKPSATKQAAASAASSAASSASSAAQSSAVQGVAGEAAKYKARAAVDGAQGRAREASADVERKARDVGAAAKQQAEGSAAGIERGAQHAAAAGQEQAQQAAAAARQTAQDATTEVERKAQQATTAARQQAQGTAAVAAATPSAFSTASSSSSSSSSSSRGRGSGPLSRLASYALFLFGSTFLVTYYLDSRSAIHRWVAMPFLHSFMDAEEAQKLAVQLLKSGLAPRDYSDAGVDAAADSTLSTTLFGTTLDNAIGLAAGFDKQGEAIDGLFDLGFGIVEIGSVTPQPQPGNARPRYFRLPSHSASINRFGFNSDGHAVVLDRLLARVRDHLVAHPHLIPANFLPDPRSPDADPRISRHQAIEMAAERLTRDAATVAQLLDHHSLPRSLRPGRFLSVNLGKNKTSAEDDASDFVRGVETFGPLADMLVVNVSSPNTPGLRDLQKRESLQKLLSTLVQSRNQLQLSRRPPLVVKIAPDLTPRELDDVASVVIDAGIDGVIVSNTTIQRPQEVAATLPAKELSTFAETGGLSGPPLRPIARKALRDIVGRLREAGKEVIAAGGISSPEDVLEATRDGASAVQVYTAFGWQGVGMVARWKDELRALLKGDGQQQHSTTWQLLAHESRTAAIKAQQERKRVAQQAFQREASSVKGELAQLKQQYGGGDSDTTAVFWPDEDDAGYNALLANARSALGIPHPHRPSAANALKHTETAPALTLQASGSAGGGGSSSVVEDKGGDAARTIELVGSEPLDVSVDSVKVYGKSEAEEAAEKLESSAGKAGAKAGAGARGVSAVVREKAFEGVDRARRV